MSIPSDRHLDPPDDPPECSECDGPLNDDGSCDDCESEKEPPYDPGGGSYYDGIDNWQR